MSQFNKPIIGVIARTDTDSDGEHLICMYEKVRKPIIKKGGIPFLIIPPQYADYDKEIPSKLIRLTEEEKQILYQQIDLCDALLIPGGYKWYEFDAVIYEYALKKDMPILGICAGMQMMARVDNDIKEIITKKNETEINHHQREIKYVHYVDIKPDTKLYEIVKKDKIKVNSKHSFHITKTKDFVISAYSEDGLIEAIEYTDKRFVLGVQWHPESMIDFDEAADHIFSKFMKESMLYRETKNKEEEE